MSTPAQPTAEERIAALVAQLESHDDPRLAPARELVQRVLQLHAEGVNAMMSIVAAADRNGSALVDCFLADRRILPLLLLHGAHPHSVERRVRDAVERMRAELGTQGVRVDVVGVTPRATRLKLEFSGQSFSRNVGPLREMIEAGILGLAPEIERIDIEGLPEHGDVAVVPVSAVRRAS
jgi:hypothetical protein